MQVHALHTPRSSLIPWTPILMAPSPAQLPPLPGVAQMSFPSFPWNSSSTHTSKVLCILLLLCGCPFTSLLRPKPGSPLRSLLSLQPTQMVAALYFTPHSTGPGGEVGHLFAPSCSFQIIPSPAVLYPSSTESRVVSPCHPPSSPNLYCVPQL